MGHGTQIETRLATVQRGFDAFESREFEVLREICHPWLDFRDEMGPLMGIESVRSYMQDWFAHLDHFRAELGETIELGDTLVADVRQTARMQDSEIELEAHFTHVFAWHEEMIASWHIYADRERALAVARTLTAPDRRP
jgi:hypothetical protein